MRRVAILARIWAFKWTAGAAGEAQVRGRGTLAKAMPTSAAAAAAVAGNVYYGGASRFVKSKAPLSVVPLSPVVVQVFSCSIMIYRCRRRFYVH